MLSGKEFSDVFYRGFESLIFTGIRIAILLFVLGIVIGWAFF